MKIVNDRIYISRGETPTYDVKVKDKKTGIPFMLSSGMKHPVIEFIVRPSLYSKDNDYVLKAYLDYSDFKKFDDVNISLEDIPNVTINEIEEGRAPISNTGKLHKYSHDGVVEYYYHDGSKWVRYEFSISFTMSHENTSKMEEKTYKYEVVLLDGDPKYDGDDVIGFNTINYKKLLLEATDFIVGGSLSE